MHTLLNFFARWFAIIIAEISPINYGAVANILHIANRLQISLDTVKRAERGEPGIKTATLLMFLALYQRLDSFADVIDPDQDRIGISLANERLPQRVREQKYDRDF